MASGTEKGVEMDLQQLHNIIEPLVTNHPELKGWGLLAKGDFVNKEDT